jgi:arabinan endo-1,5-alpha-L-arabinosidase
MENNDQYAAKDKTGAKSAPFDSEGFTISVTTGDNDTRIFEIRRFDEAGKLQKSCAYTMHGRSHGAYLDFFQSLANDFGLRMPQNRQPVTKHSFQMAYRPLLNSNIVPEILYGYGDPAVLRVNSDHTNSASYYLVCTSNDAANSFPICRSRNLDDWEFAGFVFPMGHKPDWAADGAGTSDFWAPELHAVGIEFRLYFVARAHDTLELCIGVATATNPEGPFTAEGTPLLAGNRIDPHLLVLDERRTILYWKEDNNAIWPNLLIQLLAENKPLISILFEHAADRATALFMTSLWPWIKTLMPMEAFQAEQVFIEAVTASFGQFKQRLRSYGDTADRSLHNQIVLLLEAMRTPVYAQYLAADGKGFMGHKQLVLENDQDWEAHLVEGCWVTKFENKFYMFYSGNDFSTDQYGIGVAIANDPMGPFTKLPGPILRSTSEWWSPGHPSVALDPEGKPVMFLHAFYPHAAGYKAFRALLSVPLTLLPGEVVAGVQSSASDRPLPTGN